MTGNSSPGQGGVSRRRVLAAAGTLGGVALPSRTTRATHAAATLDVRIYPGPKPFYAWLRQACLGITSGWSPVDRDAAAAVEGTMELIASYVQDHSDLDEVTARVDRRSPLEGAVRSSGLKSSNVSAYSVDTLLESFRDGLARSDEMTGDCAHLLLWWNPLNADLGYGKTRYPNHHVCKAEGEGAQTVANVGATEWWDSRPVTRNIAIHETLHTFLTEDVAEAVNGSSCDHDLGEAVRIGDTMRVSPMATAYAGPERLGGGTQWHGSGCFDHDTFSRHDGLEGVDDWEYTSEPSEATLEAVRLYVERHLAE